MKSTEKLFLFLEHLQGLDDEELLEQFPVIRQASTARFILASATHQVPYDYRELDQKIAWGIEFLNHLRSDPDEVPNETTATPA